MKREDLPLVTPEQFKGFSLYWLKTTEDRARFEHVAALRDEWNALDVLDLENVSARDKLWMVLRVVFLPDKLLHEFACRCEEWLLSVVDSPDPRSVEAIRVKRRWMAGEATDSELDFARDAAWDAASEMATTAAWVEWAAALGAVGVTWRSAGLSSAQVADIVSESRDDSAARIAALEHKIEILRNLINEWEI